MVRDIGSSAISGRSFPDAFRGTRPKSPLAPSVTRCADVARTRGESLAASAVLRGREVTDRATVARAKPTSALLSCADELPMAEARYAAMAFSRAAR